MPDTLNKYFSSLISFLIHSILILLFYFTALHSPKNTTELFELSLDSGSGGGDNSLMNTENKMEITKQPADEFINTEKKNIEVTKEQSIQVSGTEKTGTGTGEDTGTGNNSGISLGLPSPAKPVVEAVYLVAVDEMPEPIGGIEKILSNVAYPKEAKQNGISGTVFVQAFIDENGSVRKTLLTKCIGGGCDEAALRAVSSARFKPGKDKGHYLKVQIQIPIPFRSN